MSNHPAVALEIELLTPACRKDKARLSELIADDFVEIGASGRIWRKSEAVQHLPIDAGESTYDLSLIEQRELRDDHILLLYSLNADGSRISLRSSLWRHTREGWKIFFHQGTRVD